VLQEIGHAVNARWRGGARVAVAAVQQSKVAAAALIKLHGTADPRITIIIIIALHDHVD
jgi:hypothetical protein